MSMSTTNSDIISIYKLTNKYNLRDKATVAKVGALASQKGMFTSAKGTLFLRRIKDISSGNDSDTSCIFCSKETVNGIFCSACENKIRASVDKQTATQNSAESKVEEKPEVQEKSIPQEKNRIKETAVTNGVETGEETADKKDVKKADKKPKKPFNIKSFLMGCVAGMILFAAIEFFIEPQDETNENSVNSSIESNNSANSIDSNSNYDGGEITAEEFINRVKVTAPKIAKEISSSGDNFYVDFEERNLSDLGESVQYLFSVQYPETSIKVYGVGICGEGHGVLRLSLDQNGHVVAYDIVVDNSQIGAIFLMMTVNTFNPQLTMKETENLIASTKGEKSLYMYGDYGYKCIVNDNANIILLNVLKSSLVQ